VKKQHIGLIIAGGIGAMLLFLKGGQQVVKGVGTLAKAKGIKTAYSGYISREAAANGLDTDFVVAFIMQESGGRAGAWRNENTGKSGYNQELQESVDRASYGLMQTLWRTAKSIGYGGTGPGLYNPAVSIIFGCKYLGLMVKGENGDLYRACRAYNGGPGWAKASAKSQAMTKAYADSVMATYNKIKGG
jgi:hypothetical protein